MNTQLIGAANRIADGGTRGPAFVIANSGSRSNRTFHIDADGLRERVAAVRTEGIKPGAFGSRPGNAAPAPVVDMIRLDQSDATASRKTTLRRAQAALTSTRADQDRLEAEMNDRNEKATIDAHVGGATARAKAAAAKERARAAGAAAHKTSKVQAADTSIALELDKFSTPDDAACHTIFLAWVDRVPAADKLTHRLPRVSRSRPRSIPITMSSSR